VGEVRIRIIVYIIIVVLLSITLHTSIPYISLGTEKNEKVSISIDPLYTVNSYSDYPILKFGETVGGYLSGTGDHDYYKVYVPYNTKTLTLNFDVLDYPPSPWSLNNSESNPTWYWGNYFKMYVKYGSPPTTSSYDYSSTGDIVISNPAAGPWYIMIYSHYGSGIYTLKATATFETDGVTTRYAIIVGIADYEIVYDLQYPDDDANDWYYRITTEISNPFNDNNVWVYGDNHPGNYLKYNGLATESAITQAIDYVLSMADGDDKVVFVFSGHGFYDSANKYSYICAWDCGWSPSGLEALDGFISDIELAKAFCYSAAKVFIFLDACHSGGFSEPATTNSNKKNILVVTATTAEDTTNERDTIQNGVWTYGFLDTWSDIYNNDASAYLEDIYQSTLTNPDYQQYQGDDDPQIFDGNPNQKLNLNGS